MIGSRIARPLFWLIANHDQGDRIDAFIMDSGGKGETLPVFSFKEEAEAFLRLEVLGTGWRTRKTTGEELVSLLLRSCGSMLTP